MISAELTADEYSAALDHVAGEALAAASVAAPPVDAVLVACRLGMVVARDGAPAGRARRARLGAHARGDAQTVILVRDEPRPERRQWSVAHEIGEQLAHRVFVRLSVEPEEAALGMREQVANALAGRLLLPAAWFGDAAMACDWDLPALKRQFDTASHELIARRMLDFAPSAVITIFDHGGLSFRRGNFPGHPGPLSPAEQACWKQVHTFNVAAALPGNRPHVFGWPIHEPGWKREILRTIVAKSR